MPGARVWLEGGAGTGKTTIADAVASDLEKSHPVIRMAGDAGNRGTKFLALHRALAGKRQPKSVRDAFKASLTAPLRAIPLVGGTAAELAKIAVAAQTDVHPEFLTAEQQDLLSGLQRIAAGRQLLIVVDDVGWLDQDTAQLILNFSLPEIQAAYSFSKTAALLFIENTDAKSTLDTALLEKLRTPDRIRVPRASKEEFSNILKAFGLDASFDSGVLSAVHNVANGHLEIAKQIAQTLKSGDTEPTQDGADIVALMVGMLMRRLANDVDGKNVERLLSIASCIGSAFSEAEVRCAFRNESAFTDALDFAMRENLLQSRGASIEFAHDIIRAAAERLGSTEAREMHEKLGDCIRLLRPGDYPSRLKHAELAGNAKLSRELAFVISMQATRGDGSLSLHMSAFDSDKTLTEDAMTAYHLMDAGKHRQALSLLTPHYDGEFGLVQGEVVALIALNQIKQRTQDSYQGAASLLEHWEQWNDEPEVWQRLMSILMAAWVACGEIEKATALYTRLAAHLMRLSAGDPTARSRAEALNRKADQFFTSEISIKHVQRAVSWFGPSEGSETPRHSFEYTSSLVNLSGAQYTLGRFEDAARNASDALAWIEELHRRGLRTTESYKALNNYVISAYRAGIETAEAGVGALNLLLSNSETGWRLDRSLVAINLGALRLLAGQTENARELLEAVWAHTVQEELDDYYVYYAAANLAAARVLTGDRLAARGLLSGLSPEAFPKWYHRAHIRRNALMMQACEDVAIDTAQALDEFPRRHRLPDGDQDAWWSIGRGLLMSDIQVWSE